MSGPKALWAGRTGRYGVKSHGFTGSHQTHSSREKHTTAILKLCLRGKEEFGGLERMTSNAHAVSTRAAPRAVQCTCALHVHLRVSSTTLRTNNAKMSKAELTVREMHFEKARPIFFRVFTNWRYGKSRYYLKQEGMQVYPYFVPLQWFYVKICLIYLVRIFLTLCFM